MGRRGIKELRGRGVGRRGRSEGGGVWEEREE